MSPVRIAVLGSGSIAEYHLAALARIPEASLRVVTSRSIAKARALAQRFAIPDASDDVTATLNREDIDAVIVTTPDDSHEELTIAALQAGKSVLVQKPMAATAAACERMRAAATSTGRSLEVSFMHRYFDEVEAAQQLLASGVVGKVTSVRVRNATPGPDWSDWVYRRKTCPAGVVLQLGIHGIDLIGVMFGSIKTVSARVATLVPVRALADGRRITAETPDTAFALYEMTSGCLVHHEMSMIETAGTSRFRMEIQGALGTLTLRTERGPLALYTASSGVWEMPELPDTLLGLRHHRLWIDSLLGRADMCDTARAGAWGLRVAEAILRSGELDGQSTSVM